MGRRRRDDGVLGDLFEACYDTFQHVPFWVGPIIAAVGFALLRWVPALFIEDGPAAFLFVKLFGFLGWAVGIVVLCAWAAAEFRKLTSRRLVDGAQGPESLRRLTWREFEQLVAEIHRRKGYMAEVVGRASGDGGVDIELNGHGKWVLVQCKHWKAFKVGVKEVREFHSVVVSRRADGGVVATSGRFTDEAERCAKENRIELLDGVELERLMREVRAGGGSDGGSRPRPVEHRVAVGESATDASPACPACGGAMVRRTARKGANAGSEFWGCSGYPKCRGTRAIGEAVNA